MIYIHFPYCRSFCTYCGFYSETAPRNCTDFGTWTDEVCREAAERTDEIERSKGVNTLYIGGGTPSLLSLDSLRRVLEALPGGISHRYAEFTVECNPDDITEELARGLKECGVSRISMGVQSFDDGMLRWMNRRHDAAQAQKAVGLLREAGFENISIDLIFGISDMEDRVWENSIGKALELGPEHISAYQLSIEEDSALAVKIAKGEYSEASDETCGRQYETLCRMLGDAGYLHYEVSNFARPGHESVHNSAYWRRVPYAGLGPGAHSFDGDRTRKWNSARLSGWRPEEEMLSDEDIRVETLMLGLRTSHGVGSAWMRDNCDSDVLRALIGEGALETAGDRLRIPESRFFVSDEIIRELL